MSNSAERARRLADVAADQAGLLSREQLHQLGVDADLVRNHVRAGRWRMLSRRVVAVHTGPLREEAVRWFAVLDGGPKCVLSGLSALQSHGLDGFAVDRVQTAVPLGGLPGRHPLYVRRRSRRLTTGAVHPARALPTLQCDVALVDTLETITLPLRGCALIAAVVQQRLLTPVRVREVVVAQATLPHRRVYVAVAGDVEGGAHSLLEIDFVALARLAGIPRPIGQSVRVDGLGRRRYLDADFDGFAVEVDGALHLRPLAWWDDMSRSNEIALTGKPLLRFPSVAIRLHRDVVIDQLRRAAARWLR